MHGNQGPASLADESLNPAFRRFIDTWARKIESGEPRRAFPEMGVPDCSCDPCHP